MGNKVVPGLASEPSETAVEVVHRIVQEIEAVEGVPINLLDKERRGAYIGQLSDIVMEAAKRAWGDFADGSGIKALENLRQIGIGRT